MTRVAVDGLALNVEVAGIGRPLVLLHGFTGSTETWRPFTERFSTGHRVIAVDLLGHGRSDSPSHPERYRVECQVEDLAAILDALDVSDYDLLGYSMGGRLALHLALAHTDRVRSLILESASPGIESPAERALRIQQDESLAERLDHEGIIPFVDRWERLPLFAGHSRLPEDTQRQLRQQRLSGDPVGLAGSLRGFGAGVPEPLTNRLPDLPRTLLIAGERDEKYCVLAGRMAEAIPDSTVAIVPDAGHTVHLEKPEEFADLVIAFLDTQTTGSGMSASPLPINASRTRPPSHPVDARLHPQPRAYPDGWTGLKT